MCFMEMERQTLLSDYYCQCRFNGQYSSYGLTGTPLSPDLCVITNPLTGMSELQPSDLKSTSFSEDRL